MSNQTINEMTEAQVAKLVNDFNIAKRNHDRADNEFKLWKDTFYRLMEANYGRFSNGAGKLTVASSDDAVDFESIVVTRVVQSEVQWDVKRLKTVLGADQYKQVVSKQFMVNDWQGLFNFLKESGVNAKEFLEYVDVTEVVNEKALDKLVDLGEVDQAAVKSCGKVNVKGCHYRVQEK